jgi:predicted glutamine amidotransferase
VIKRVFYYHLLLQEFLFFLDKNFKEGDNIILESEEATIVRIGIMRTIFRMKKNSNWYFVHNGRIKYLRLEKKVEQ